eukprot:480840-Rhodomonas_salina.1
MRARNDARLDSPAEAPGVPTEVPEVPTEVPSGVGVEAPPSLSRHLIEDSFERSKPSRMDQWAPTKPLSLRSMSVSWRLEACCPQINPSRYLGGRIGIYFRTAG